MCESLRHDSDVSLFGRPDKDRRSIIAVITATNRRDSRPHAGLPEPAAPEDSSPDEPQM